MYYLIYSYMNMCVFLGEICGTTSICLLKCSYFLTVECNPCEMLEHPSFEEFLIKTE